MLKNPRVREAKSRDIGLFKKLFKRYLESQVELGSLILPTQDNVEVFANIFKMYIDKDIPEEAKQDGTVLFIADVAVIMLGNSGSAVESSMGRTAMLWGVYVVPEHRGKGLCDLLYKEGMMKIKAMGFDTLYTSILLSNEHGLKAFERGTGQKAVEVPERSVFVKIN